MYSHYLKAKQRINRKNVWTCIVTIHFSEFDLFKTPNYKCSRFSKHSLEDYNNKTVIGLFDKTLNKFYVIRKIS